MGVKARLALCSALSAMKAVRGLVVSEVRWRCPVPAHLSAHAGGEVSVSSSY